MSAKEVRNLLGITPHTFFKWRKRYRNFRTVKIGNRLYMRRESYEAFLRELEEEQNA